MEKQMGCVVFNIIIIIVVILLTTAGIIYMKRPGLFHCEQFLTVLDFLRKAMKKIVVILEVVKKAAVILSYGSIVHDNPE